jgi:hypothetical protein
MNTLVATSLASSGMLALFAIVGFGFVFGILSHRGSLDESAITDIVMSTDAQLNQVALVANSVIPQNYLTGAADVYLSNTTNAPGTQTTRTAAQLYADAIAQMGIQNLIGITIAIRVTHQGTGTLTLGAGTGVTFGTGTYTVATGTFRDFILTFTSPTTATLQTTGVGTWS